MAWYRMYFLSSSGHIERTKEINCSNDAEAIAALDSEDSSAELWQRDRFIKSTDALIGVDPVHNRSRAEQTSRVDSD